MVAVILYKYVIFLFYGDFCLYAELCGLSGTTELLLSSSTAAQLLLSMSLTEVH